MINPVTDQHVNTADVASIGVLVGAVMDFLPNVATVLTVVWLALRVYESPTVQRWIYGEPTKDDE